MAVICPECDSPILVEEDDVERGATLQCEECGVDLEVVSVDPVELVALEEGYEDEPDLRYVEEEDEE